MTQPNKTQMTT